MTTEEKALALVNEIECEEGVIEPTPRIMRGLIMDEALCRAIEQHEAFRQEVSDACNAVWDLDTFGREQVKKFLSRFIIAKPDPLVEVLQAVDEFANPTWVERIAPQLRAALAARGLKIVEDKP